MSTMTSEYRPYDGTIGDIGGLDVTLDGLTVKFDNAHGDAFSCQSCGAAVADWRHTTDKETGQTVNAPKVNIERHVAFHARLGF
jgi:hypothetical protein